MPTYQAPLRDIRFVLEEYLPLDCFAGVPGITDVGMDLALPVLEEAAKLCEQALFPLNQSGDSEGCTFNKGEVTCPTGFADAYKSYREGGWSALTCDPDYGGQGLPEWLNMPVIEMICSANLSFGITPGLSHGFYNALALHGSDELKQTYLPHIVSGLWSGVMCLTEPQCGTDLGLIRTKAEPKDDGSYAISGTKIFISSGEHDMTENILHLVLAKLPDAPSGVKGISLFLVPKFLLKEDGALGERNSVTCGSIEHKMGIKASPTCVMNYENAIGWLVGEPHKGLRAMFTMMNAARLYVGVQGLGLAETAYQNARDYAMERLQGRGLKGPEHPDKAADPIIVHPDVRRMLLLQKSFVEAGRAIAVETALKLDIAHKHPDAPVRAEADAWVQLMTPIIKAYFTDMGYEMTTLAQQIYGGHGYIHEYGMEQYVRDARIAQIYEGANGIQALDLIGRKLPTKYGIYLRSFFHPLDEFIAHHQDNPAMKEFIKPLRKHMGYLQQASLWLAQQGLGNPNAAASGASEYLRMFGIVAQGFAWARMAATALDKLEHGTDDKEFYESKLEVARFTMQKVLPQTVSLLMSITAGDKPVMTLKAEGF